MKRTLLEKLGDFVLGKGFYIVLFLCVATIGISGYYLIQTLTPAGTSEPVTGNPTVTLPDESTAGTVQSPPLNIPSGAGDAGGEQALRSGGPARSCGVHLARPRGGHRGVQRGYSGL